MCTVVCRWAPGDHTPVQLLALRDELASRAFDPPGAWWPEQPGTIGGRDRRAGGSWCVTDVAAGRTAVVLNRPERRTAEAGAPSRGVLPLVGARYGRDWAEHVEIAGMASFNLVVAEPGSLDWWRFDGRDLVGHSLDAGVHMFTPHGLVGPGELDARFAAGRAVGAERGAATGEVWTDWLAVLHERRPSADPGGLIVRHPVDGDSYETVFGQFIASRPGWLRLDYLDRPADGTDREWTTVTTTA